MKTIIMDGTIIKLNTDQRNPMKQFRHLELKKIKKELNLVLHTHESES